MGRLKTVVFGSCTNIDEFAAHQIIDSFKAEFQAGTSAPLVTFDEDTQTFSGQIERSDEETIPRFVALLNAYTNNPSHHLLLDSGQIQLQSAKGPKNLENTSEACPDPNMHPLIEFGDDKTNDGEGPSTVYWKPANGDIQILSEDLAKVIKKVSGCLFRREPNNKRIILLNATSNIALKILENLEPLLTRLSQQRIFWAASALDGNIFILGDESSQACIDFVQVTKDDPSFDRIIVDPQAQSFLDQKLICHASFFDEDRFHLTKPRNLNLSDVSLTVYKLPSQIWKDFKHKEVGREKEVQPASVLTPESVLDNNDQWIDLLDRPAAGKNDALGSSAADKVTLWKDQVIGANNLHTVPPPQDKNRTTRSRRVFVDPDDSDDGYCEAKTEDASPKPTSTPVPPVIIFPVSPEQDKYVGAFMQALGSDEATARRYLQNANNDFAVAVQNCILDRIGQGKPNADDVKGAGRAEILEKSNTSCIYFNKISQVTTGVNQSLGHAAVRTRKTQNDQQMHRPGTDISVFNETRLNNNFANTRPSYLSQGPWMPNPHAHTYNPQPQAYHPQPQTCSLQPQKYHPQPQGRNPQLVGNMPFSKLQPFLTQDNLQVDFPRGGYRLQNSSETSKPSNREFYCDSRQGYQSRIFSQARKGPQTQNQVSEAVLWNTRPSSDLGLQKLRRQRLPKIQTNFADRNRLLTSLDTSHMDSEIVEDDPLAKTDAQKHFESDSDKDSFSSALSWTQLRDENSHLAKASSDPQTHSDKDSKPEDQPITPIQNLKERKQSSAEIGMRRYFNTMNQMAGNPGRVKLQQPKQESKKQRKERVEKIINEAYGQVYANSAEKKSVNPSKDTGGYQGRQRQTEFQSQTQNLKAQLMQSFELARAFPGKLRFEIQFGQILVSSHPDILGNKFFDRKSCLAKFNGENDQPGLPTAFTNILTTNGADVDRALEMKAQRGDRKAKLWQESSDCSYEVLYKFQCKSSAGEEVLLIVDQEGRYILEKAPQLIGKVNVHFPCYIWDACAILEGAYRCLDVPEALADEINGLISSMFIKNKAGLLHITLYDLANNELEVFGLQVERISSHSCNQGDLQDCCLKITEIKKFYREKNDQHRNSLHFFEKDFDTMISEQRLHYSMAIVSSEMQLELAGNETLELGELTDPETTGKAVLKTERLHNMLELTAATVKNIDFMGAQNMGTLRRLANEHLKKYPPIEKLSKTHSDIHNPQVSGSRENISTPDLRGQDRGLVARLHSDPMHETHNTASTFRPSTSEDEGARSMTDTLQLDTGDILPEESASQV